MEIFPRPQDSPQQVTQGKVKTVAFLPQLQRKALQPEGEEGAAAVSQQYVPLPAWS